jgi:ABC-type transport system involved in multi-copper enzyme maturation permease subunit
MTTGWTRQFAGVLKLEMNRTLLSRNGWKVWGAALAPVVLAGLHSLFSMRGLSGGHTIGEESTVFAALFQVFYLRAAIFFGCVVIFSNAFRGEMLNKTLHYAFLTPVRREMLVAGKYLAGLLTALVLFTGGTVASFLLMGRHFGAAYSDYLWHGPGASQLGAYALVSALACVGYGAVFTLCGLLFRNPMIPAAVVWVWENLNPFLPSLLKKISVVFYLKSLCPVEVPIGPPFNILVVDTDPTPFWVAIPGLLAVAALLLVCAALAARQAEIQYGE